jgi:hypothetical protein
MYPAHEVADFSARFFELVKQSVADQEQAASGKESKQ